MSGFCIILSSASGGLGGPRTPRLKDRSLRSLHFPSILKKNPSIQNLNETTAEEAKIKKLVPWIE
jgi:hypothetical protein